MVRIERIIEAERKGLAAQATCDGVEERGWVGWQLGCACVD